MSTYWPWWAGAAGLALITINYALTTDRSFGVSSAWDRVLHWRRERRLERMDEEFTDERALADALAAATAEHFGTAPAGPATPDSSAAPAGPPAPYGTSQPLATDDEPTASEATSVSAPSPAPLVTQAALLVSIFVGGLIAALTSGRFHLRFDMGPGFRNVVTAHPTTMIVLLFVGGVLVGFGTRLAGGCSSGHGLNGCGRLRPVSLVATAVFFGTAVAVSFLLWKVI
ncbi:YeeE/YedE family protein [Streptomyces sp. NPDC001739]|uniref:YeeE/YedE family protein n=1 Tax=Streptomyces sp. NPDC001633 TaxID=3364595 RepID=UPI0036BEE334